MNSFNRGVMTFLLQSQKSAFTSESNNQQTSNGNTRKWWIVFWFFTCLFFFCNCTIKIWLKMIIVLVYPNMTFIYINTEEATPCYHIRPWDNNNCLITSNKRYKNWNTLYLLLLLSNPLFQIKEIIISSYVIIFL